jgi:hypothetical protein
MIDNNSNTNINVSLGVAWWYFTTYVLTLILVILSASGNALFAHLQLVFLTLSLAYMPSDIDISIKSAKILVQAWGFVQQSSQLQNLYNGMALRSAGLIILAIVWLVQIIQLTVKPGKVAPSHPVVKSTAV